MKLVLCSAPPDKAAALSEQLVEQRLVACVNLVPGVASVYRWQGTIEHEQETLMWMESSREVLPELMRVLERLHPYEVPKIIAVDVADATQAYAAWVQANVGPAAD